jgi:hypothetical protein
MALKEIKKMTVSCQLVVSPLMGLLPLEPQNKLYMPAFSPELITIILLQLVYLIYSKTVPENSYQVQQAMT